MRWFRSLSYILRAVFSKQGCRSVNSFKVSTKFWVDVTINGDGLWWQQWLMMVALVNLLLPGGAIQCSGGKSE